MNLVLTFLFVTSLTIIVLMILVLLMYVLSKMFNKLSKLNLNKMKYAFTLIFLTMILITSYVMMQLC